jgi:hypothetical protein
MASKEDTYPTADTPAALASDPATTIAASEEGHHPTTETPAVLESDTVSTSTTPATLDSSTPATTMSSESQVPTTSTALVLHGSDRPRALECSEVLASSQALPDELIAEVLSFLDEFHLKVITGEQVWWPYDPNHRRSPKLEQLAKTELTRRLQIQQDDDVFDARDEILAHPLRARRVRDLHINNHFLLQRRIYQSDYSWEDRIPESEREDYFTADESLRADGLLGRFIMAMTGLQHFEWYPNDDFYPESSPWVPGWNPIVRLFACDPDSDDLLQLQCFQKLRSLSLADSVVSWPWFALPKVCSVFLDISRCEVADPVSEDWKKSNVTSLNLQMPWSDLKGKPALANAVEFLWQLDRVSELGIISTEQKGPNRTQTYVPNTQWWDFGPQDWHDLVTSILAYRPTLRVLRFRLDVYAYTSRSGHIVPAPSLPSFRGFSCLRVLEITQDALLGVNHRAMHSISPQEILPATLEAIVIWTPTEHIVAWLKTLLHELSHFPKLEIVKLCCPNIDDYWDRDTYGNDRPRRDEERHVVSDWALMRMASFVALRAVYRGRGVIVDPVTEGREFNTDWDDPNYDPETGLLVEFLEERP